MKKDVEGQEDADSLWNTDVQLIVLQDLVPRGGRLAAEACCQRLLRQRWVPNHLQSGCITAEAGHFQQW